MTTITARALQVAQSKSTPYFIRDAKVKGFAAKVNPSGSIKLIAEVRHEGRTFRKTIPISLRYQEKRKKGGWAALLLFARIFASNLGF